MRRRSFLAASAVWAGLTCAENVLAGTASPLVVIASRQSPLDELPLELLRRIFLAEPLRAHGVRVIPFNTPPATSERRLFDARVLGMGPEEIARYWIARRVRGQAGSPRVVAGAELLKQLVARLPGAIGYLSHGDLDASVKALGVDGRDCIDPKYPLR